MKRVLAGIAVLAAVGGVVAPSVGATPQKVRCAVEGADIVDGGALYDEATSRLTFRITTGGPSCSRLKYHMTVYDDDVVATPLATRYTRGDGNAENADGTDFVLVSFDGIPAGDFIFCFVGNVGTKQLFDRAPDEGRFCFDTSGGGSGGGHFR
jgi:hypothetical protein